MSILLKNQQNMLVELSQQDLVDIAQAWKKAFLFEFSLGNWNEWLALDDVEFRAAVNNNFYIKNYIYYRRLAGKNSMFVLSDLKSDMETVIRKQANELQNIRSTSLQK